VLGISQSTANVLNEPSARLQLADAVITAIAAALNVSSAVVNITDFQIDGTQLNIHLAVNSDLSVNQFNASVTNQIVAFEDSLSRAFTAIGGVGNVWLVRWNTQEVSMPPLTAQPTAKPTSVSTTAPTLKPTTSTTSQPTLEPASYEPSNVPTREPTEIPTVPPGAPPFCSPPEVRGNVTTDQFVNNTAAHFTVTLHDGVWDPHVNQLELVVKHTTPGANVSGRLSFWIAELGSSPVVLTVYAVAVGNYTLEGQDVYSLKLPARSCHDKGSGADSRDEVQFDVVMGQGTPSPPSNFNSVPAAAVVSAQSISIGASMVTGVLASPSAGAIVNRLSLALSQCNELGNPLDFTAHPTRVVIGDSDARYYLGMLVMNTVLVAGVSMIHGLISLLMHVGFYRSKNPSTVFSSTAARLKFPSVSLCVIVFLQQPIVAGITVVLTQSTDPGAIAAAVVVFLLMIGYMLAVAHLVVRMIPRGATFVLKPSPEHPFAHIHHFFCGDGEWLDVETHTKPDPLLRAPDVDAPGTTTSIAVKEVDDLSVRSSAHERTELFGHRFGGYFDDYHDRARWFVLIEMTLNIMCGILEGVQYISCPTQMLLGIFCYFFFFAANVLLRPSQARFNNIHGIALAAGQFLVAMLAVISVYTNSDQASSTAQYLVLFILYATLGKAALDIFIVFVERTVNIAKKQFALAAAKKADDDARDAAAEPERARKKKETPAVLDSNNDADGAHARAAARGSTTRAMTFAVGRENAGLLEDFLRDIGTDEGRTRILQGTLREEVVLEAAENDEAPPLPTAESTAQERLEDFL